MAWVPFSMLYQSDLAIHHKHAVPTLLDWCFRLFALHINAPAVVSIEITSVFWVIAQCQTEICRQNGMYDYTTSANQPLARQHWPDWPRL